MDLNFYSKAILTLGSLRKSIGFCLVAAILFVNNSQAQSASALSFDGSNDFVNVPVKPALNVVNAITIEAWIKPTKISGTQDVISKSSATTSNGYIFPRTSTGWTTIEFLLNINTQGWKTLKINYGADKRNEWHHVAATYDGNTMRIYIDGALSGSYDFAGAITVNNNALTFGTQTGLNEFYGGAVDDARIFNRALSACEIVNSMNCEMAGNESGLVAYYKFNQGLLGLPNPLETTLQDASPTGANGTLNNFGLLGTSLLSNWSDGNPNISSTVCPAFTPISVTAGNLQALVPVSGTINLTATFVSGATYSWTGPNGFTSNLQNPTIVGVGTNASGTYTVSANVGGCAGTSSTVITVAPSASGLNFDGIDDYAIASNNSVLNSDAISVEAWIYPTSSSSGVTSIQNVASNANADNNTGFKFPKTNDKWNSFSFELSVDNVWKELTYTFPTSSVNKWNHVAATFDGYFMRIYLNGILVGTSEVTGTYTKSDNPLILGNNDDRFEYFRGSVDELRIWNRAISQCEIINNMKTCELNGDNGGLANQSQLAVYYRFNQGLLNLNNSAYSTVIDSSGHGVNATLMNFGYTGTVSNWLQGKVYGICDYFPLPLLNASANGSVFQTGSTAKLFSNYGNNDVYNWDGPNSFATTTQNPVLNNVQINQSGIYTVTTPYVNCVVTASTKIKVTNLPQIVAAGPTSFCPSGSVSLSTSSVGTIFQWFLNDVAINGATTNTYVATAGGNYSVKVTNGTDVIISAPLLVTVIPDVTAPTADVATLPTLTVVAPATITSVPTATDACRGAITGTTTSPLTYTHSGTYTITWNYNDGNGNTSTQTQTVVVTRPADGTPPILTVPANISVAANWTTCNAVVTFAATATDESEDPTVTITYSQNPGTIFPIGTTTVNVTATDAAGNVSTGSFNVTVTGSTVAPITGTTTVCVGSTTTLSTATTDGTWSSANTAVATVNPSTGVVTGVAAGTVNIIYTNSCGVTASAAVTVNAKPTAPTVAAVDNCGTSTLTVSNTTGTILWSNGATTASITVSTAGTYTATQSVNGCASAAGSVVAAPKALPATPTVTVVNNCGTSTLTANAAGTVLWSNGATTTSITVSTAGTYTVAQTLNGCTSAAGSGVAAPKATPSTPTVTVTNNCGTSTLTSNASGTVLWSNGATTASITVSTAGTYTVAQSANGCTSAAGSGIAAPKATPSAPTVTVADNCGTSTLTANAAGTVLWSNGATTTSITVSTAGTYTVAQTVNGCTSAAGSGVAAPKTIPSAPTVTVANNCGTSTLTSNAAGTILWSNGATTASITVSTAGTYTVTQSANGCTSAAGSGVAAPKATPSAPIVTVADNCGTSTLTANAAGTVLWSNGATTTSITVSTAGTYTVAQTVNGCTSAAGSGVAAPKAIPSTPTVTVADNCGTSTLTSNAAGTILWSNGATTASITVSTAGTYTVTQSANGCTSAAGSGVAAPKAVQAAPVVTVTNNCGSTTLTSNVSGSWSNGSTGTSINVTTGGSYTVTASNASGCTAATTTAVTVNTNPTVAAITGNTSVVAGTTTQLSSTTSGGVWSSNSANATVSASGLVTGVTAGTATITYTVTTAAGCSASVNTVVTVTPAAPTCTTPVFTSTVSNISINAASTQCSAAASYTATTSGTTPTITYTFSGATTGSGNGTGSGATFNLGTTTVTIKAVNNCGTASTSFTVTVKDVTAPTAITKNITVALDADGNAAVTPAQVNNGSSDNCSVVTLAFKSTTTATAPATGTICGTVDENGTLTLTAPTGATITSINFASYGTPNGTCGSFTVNASCNASNSKSIVEGYALGRNSISIPATNDVFGDPCPGTYKRLYVQATYTVTATTAPSGSTVSSISYDCSNKGANTVTLAVTDASGNVSYQTATVTVVDNIAPTVTAVPAQTFCGTAGSYSVPTLATDDNCAVTSITYAVTGATTRTGTGNNASGTFNVGTSTITWTVKDASGNTTTSTATVVLGGGPVASIAAGSSSADFCSEIVLTGSSSVSGSSYKWMSGSTVVGTSNQFSLGQGSAEGVYQLYVTSAAGCTSTAASYTFNKQNLGSSYTILATSAVVIGKYNKVASGSVGITTSWGYAYFKGSTAVNGANSFVKAPYIYKGSSDNITKSVNGTASVTGIPAMQYNTASTYGLSNYTTGTYSTVTLTGNYKTLTIRKGTYATLSGTTFGTIDMEEGASIRFTNATINIDRLLVEDGARDGYYSYVRFAPNSSIRVSTQVSIGSQVLVNPDNYKVTFFMGDNNCDAERFTVKGADTKVIANIIMPSGKLLVTSTDCDNDSHGNCGHSAHSSWNCPHSGHNHKACDHKSHNTSDCNDDVYMTGTFIAEYVESAGNTVIWNSYACGSSPIAVTVVNKTQTVGTSSITSETSVPTTEEELKITVMPNPSTTYFTLKFESKYATPINMRVMDASGRVVDAQTKLGSNSTTKIGANYTSGTYYAEIIQGATRKVIQLIKVRG